MLGSTKYLYCYILFLQYKTLSLLSRELVLSQLLYADDLDLMSETIEGLMNKFTKWKEDFDSKGVKVHLWKTKVLVSEDITTYSISKSKVNPFTA